MGGGLKEEKGKEMAYGLVVRRFSGRTVNFILYLEKIE